jgi:hypothetical protein
MTNQYDARQFTRGKYLKAAELDKRRAVSVTIQKVTPTDFEGQESKLVLSFLEIDQEMPCNKSQARALMDSFGFDIRLWVDQTINLRQGTTFYQGKQMPTILVEEAEIVAPGSEALAVNDTADVLF